VSQPGRLAVVRSNLSCFSIFCGRWARTFASRRRPAGSDLFLPTLVHRPVRHRSSHRTLAALAALASLVAVSLGASALVPLAEFADVASGNAHACALTTAGRVKCWGSGFYLGEGLGSGNYHSTIPVAVPSLTDVVSIAAGLNHSCALTGSGAVWCWGENSSGQLGDGTTDFRLSPVRVDGLDAAAMAVAVGWSHTCVVLDDGSARCWGDNAYGQLGDGTKLAHHIAAPVVGLDGTATRIASGTNHNCVILSGGAVRCWGDNYSGQAGTGSNAPALQPVAALPYFGTATAITGGSTHTCAVNTGGEVWCWGGRTGDGTYYPSYAPKQVLGVMPGAVSVSSKVGHTCALTAGGNLQCWGDNYHGQLGDGTQADALSPVTVAGISGATRISVGYGFTCALMADRRIRCWGSNYDQTLGIGVENFRLVPTPVVDLPADMLAIAAGAFDHSCGVNKGGTAYCWGRNLYGQLGDGTQFQRAAPVPVAALGANVAAIAVAQDHSCALLKAGAVRCWGGGFQGQLGNGQNWFSAVPVPVEGLDSGVTAISSAGVHTCALKQEGAVVCWGGNHFGELGDGTQVDRVFPVAVSGMGSGVIAIAAGRSHTCAVKAGGAAFCWGLNDEGELGDGSVSNRTVPVPVQGLGSGVIAIAAGGLHSCALVTGRVVKCWGGGAGNGQGYTTLTPMAVSGLSTNVTAVSAGLIHSCAIDAGIAKCWGYNVRGALGRGDNGDGQSATAVTGLTAGAISISAGYWLSCAVATGGAGYCWGNGDYDQLGDGMATFATSPQQVMGTVIDPVYLPVGTVGSPYGATLTTTGGSGPYAYSMVASGLAGGLVLSPSGTLSGVPTGAGLFAFAIASADSTSPVDNGPYRSSVAYRLWIQDPAEPPTVDLDGNGDADALTDGLMIVRTLLGLTGPSVTAGATAGGAPYSEPPMISTRYARILPYLDIDGNSRVDALTDGIILVRYLFGIRGTALVAGALGVGATRTMPSDIATYIDQLLK